MSERGRSKALQRLVKDLGAAQGDNLASITLYGSVAAGQETPEYSDHNVLVVLKRLGFEDLQRSHEAIKGWKAAGQLPPVFFAIDELKRAADVFPIEFLQMENAREVLYGSDPFELVEISRGNLRRQIEYELRTKLIQLRRLCISGSLSADSLSALMSDSITTFLALFRAVLVLHDKPSPVSNADALHAVAGLLSLESAPFEWIFKQRMEKDSAATEDEVYRVFAAYLTEIERVIDAVDRLEDN